MLSKLDPHSIYIEPKTVERNKENFSGHYEGIGIQFDVINGYITVISPIAGSPSERLGLIPGDKIVKIKFNDYDTCQENYENSIRVEGTVEIDEEAAKKGKKEEPDAGPKKISVDFYKVDLHNVFRLLILKQLDHHGGKTINSVGRLPPAGAQFRQGMVGPINK